MYPDLPATSPFSGWNAMRSTRSLTWYDDYNGTKHDRESNFGRATLRSAIDSVCAVAVMLCAQFGPEAVPAGIRIFMRKSDPMKLYVPLMNAQRTTRPDGTTEGISWGGSERWTEKVYVF